MPSNAEAINFTFLHRDHKVLGKLLLPSRNSLQTASPLVFLSAFEIFLHQHFLCSRGQKRRSCQHSSQHNSSLPFISCLGFCIQTRTPISGGWENFGAIHSLFSHSLSPLSPLLALLFLSPDPVHQVPWVALVLRWGLPSLVPAQNRLQQLIAVRRCIMHQATERDSDWANKQGVWQCRLWWWASSCDYKAPLAPFKRCQGYFSSFF